MRTTHTVALMDVTPETFNEIKKKLTDAGYDHAIDSVAADVLDMTGIGLKLQTSVTDKQGS
jgi:hypothetical protein